VGGLTQRNPAAFQTLHENEPAAFSMKSGVTN
jgi:hypothetical protein